MRSVMMRCLLLAWTCCWAAAVAAAQPPVILVIGDSLSSGYGMDLEDSWPRLLQRRLADNGQRYQVVNASITGDTTRGGLARLPRLLEKHQPRFVILELGGNDGLRGLPIEVTRSNLDTMIELSREAGAEVVLAGIVLPPNYGPAYTTRFQALYPELAEEHGALLVPFFMEGVALNEAMMQPDGIHPNAVAQSVLLDNLWEVLGPRLRGEG